MEQNKEFYDAWASKYDIDENSTVFIDEIMFPKFYLDNKINLALEIGCGTGRHTQRLAQIAKKIVAIDLSQNMIDKAKSKLKTTNVDFIVGDFLSLDLKKYSKFDIAIMALVLEHLENIKPVFNKIYDQLNDGASFFLSEIHPFRMQNGSGARYFDEEKKIEIRAKSFCHSESEIENAAINAGFEIKQKAIHFGTKNLEKINPNWKKYTSKPMILVYEFTKS